MERQFTDPNLTGARSLTRSGDSYRPCGPSKTFDCNKTNERGRVSSFFIGLGVIGFVLLLVVGLIFGLIYFLESHQERIKAEEVYRF